VRRRRKNKITTSITQPIFFQFKQQPPINRETKEKKMSKIKNKKDKQITALTDLTRNFNAAELNLIWFQKI